MVRIAARLRFVVLVFALSVAGCGDSDSSGPTSPTPSPAPAPSPTPAPTPPPAPTTAALSGTVSNTSGQRIAAARITVLDGPDTGRSVETNGNGEYTFPTLTIADVNFIARASGYVEQGRGVRVNGTNTLDFTLTPVPPPTPAITITSRIVSGGPGTAIQEWAFVATGTVPFTSYDWSFGDGGAATNSGPQEQHVYTTRGTFTVTVVGRRANGSPVTGTLVIEVM